MVYGRFNKQKEIEKYSSSFCKNIGETYIDSLGNCEEEVTIDEDGCGNFGVKSRSVSVWIKK